MTRTGLFLIVVIILSAMSSITFAAFENVTFQVVTYYDGQKVQADSVVLSVLDREYLITYPLEVDNVNYTGILINGSVKVDRVWVDSQKVLVKVLASYNNTSRGVITSVKIEHNKKIRLYVDIKHKKGYVISLDQLVADVLILPHILLLIGFFLSAIIISYIGPNRLGAAIVFSASAILTWAAHSVLSVYYDLTILDIFVRVGVGSLGAILLANLWEAVGKVGR